MKVLKILAWVFLLSTFSMALQGFSMMQNPEVPDPRIAYVYFAMGGFFALLSIICFAISSKGAKSSRGESKGSFNENYYKKRKKAVNYKFRVFLSLVLSFAGAIAIAYFLPDKIKTFQTIGGFIWKYLIFFAGFYLVFAIYSGSEIKYFENADLFINTNCFVPFAKNINWGNFFVYRFRSTFPGIFSKGPLVYTTAEGGIAVRRKIYMFIATIVKFISPFVALIGFVSVIFEIFAFNGTSFLFDPTFALENVGNICGLLILCFGPTIDVFFYTIKKMLPFRESNTYDITIYYQSGKIEKTTQIETNFIALLFVSLVVYVYTSGWFWYICACNMARVKDTNKLMAYGRRTGRNVNFVEYYLDENAN